MASQAQSSAKKRNLDSKPSLLEPDFTGLWSVARLGHEKRWWSKLLGTIVLSLFVYSWYAWLIFIIDLVNIKFADKFTYTGSVDL